MTTETSKGIFVVDRAFSTRAGTFLTLAEAEKALRLKIAQEFIETRWPHPTDYSSSYSRRLEEHITAKLIADHFEDIINLFKAEGVY